VAGSIPPRDISSPRSIQAPIFSVRRATTTSDRLSSTARHSASFGRFAMGSAISSGATSSAGTARRPVGLANLVQRCARYIEMSAGSSIFRARRFNGSIFPIDTYRTCAHRGPATILDWSVGVRGTQRSGSDVAALRGGRVATHAKEDFPHEVFAPGDRNGAVCCR
jgi:hypothetical protein